MSSTIAHIYTTEEYSELNPSYHVEDSPWKAHHILTMLSRHQLAPNSVAEVGCGAGESLRCLQAKMPSSVTFDGYEISPAAHSRFLSRDNERLKFHCIDLLAATTPNFDLCLCMDVIEHVPDYLGFVSELKTKATYKLFHIPLDLSALSLLRGWPLTKSRKTIGHIHSFFKDSALATLEDAGHEVVDWFYTSGVVDRPATLKARLMRAPRRILHRINPDLCARLLGGYSMMILTR